MVKDCVRLVQQHISNYHRFPKYYCRVKLSIACLILICLFVEVKSSCQSSILNPSVIVSKKDSIIHNNNAALWKVVSPDVSANSQQSSKSNNLYYLYHSSYASTDYCTIRKENPDYSEKWMISIQFRPVLKSLAVDSIEKNVYVGIYNSNFGVCIIDANTGNIILTYTFSNIEGMEDNISIFPTYDSSFYIINQSSETGNINICQVNIKGDNLCKEIQNLAKFTYVQLKLNDTTFICAGRFDSSQNIFISKLDFTESSAQWTNMLSCASSLDCTSNYSECLADNNKSNAYCFLAIGCSGNYLFYSNFNTTNGLVVGTRYKSTANISMIYGSAMSGDTIIASVVTPEASFVVMLNISSSLFTIRMYNNSLYSCGFEPSTSRFIVGGILDSASGYIYATMFSASLFSVHFDFQSSSWTMDVISNEEDLQIELTSPASLAAVASSGINLFLFSEESFLFNQVISGISYNTESQSFWIIENKVTELSPNLTCSLSSSYTINYSLSLYSSELIPSWITIDSKGKLKVSVPQDTYDQKYNFNVVSNISGVAYPIKKLINLTVAKCAIDNCKYYSSDLACSCAICNYGFYLCDSTCGKQSNTLFKNSCIDSDISEQAKVGKLAILLTTMLAVIVVFMSSFMKTSSTENLWLFLKQMQLFFILLLTRAFIPMDVQTCITGFKFQLNPYEYIPFTNIRIYNLGVDNFNFVLTDTMLEPFGVKSDSTIYNFLPFIDFMLGVALVHFLLLIFMKLLSRLPINDESFCCFKVIKYTVEKALKILTFTYYIRSILEFNQFAIICSIYEIKIWNISGSLRITSLVFAIFVLLACLLLVLMISYLALSSYKILEGKHNKLEKFFRGVKSQNKYKFFVVAALIRRLLYIVLCITTASLSSRILIAVLTLCQIAYLIYILVLRPFNEFKTNIIEIQNESYFLLILTPLIFLNEEHNWSQTVTSIYIWVIVSNNIMNFIIIFVDFCLNLVSKIKSKCFNARVNTRGTANVEVIHRIAQRDNIQINNQEQERKSKFEKNSSHIAGRLPEESKSEFEENLSNVRVFRLPA